MLHYTVHTENSDVHIDIFWAILLGGLELFSCLLLIYYSSVFNQVFFLINSNIFWSSFSVGLLFNTNKLEVCVYSIYQVFVSSAAFLSEKTR